ncbi:M15 family metallopeptidase [Propionibacteriaceae bacterium Y2011]
MARPTIPAMITTLVLIASIALPWNAYAESPTPPATPGTTPSTPVEPVETPSQPAGTATPATPTEPVETPTTPSNPPESPTTSATPTKPEETPTAGRPGKSPSAPRSTPPTSPPSASTRAVTPIQQRYADLGGEDGVLGKQTAAETELPDGGRMAVFEGGRIYWSPDTGAQETWGAIMNRWGGLGWQASRLGYPTGPEHCTLRDDGCFQRFELGNVYYLPGVGAQPVWGAIGGRWGNLGWENGALGYPITGEQCGIRDGGCFQKFENGHIHWSRASGAHETWGAIMNRWGSLGWERSRLGYPTGPEQCGLRDGGCFQRFQGGIFYYVPGVGANPIWGSIGTRWGGLGWENGQLGYPISTESCGIRDGGCYQKFEHGHMYYVGGVGAHPVLGAIRDTYRSMGWERSPLAYPTGAEVCSGGSCRQSFQYGTITWAPGRITVSYEIRAVIRRTTAADVLHTYRSGCPVGPANLRTIEMNYWGFDGLLHRGELIVRDHLASEVVAAFTDALNARWRFAQIENPNEWGGADPPMMQDNNTSGFNCRPVVGNPYAVSPHSYGTAIDTNTVQNPYRDRNGTWWPSNGHPYILGAVLNRKQTHFAVMTTSSPMTRALESRGWFWGGRWSPGRDYHHFERR